MVVDSGGMALSPYDEVVSDATGPKLVVSRYKLSLLEGANVK